MSSSTMMMMMNEEDEEGKNAYFKSFPPGYRFDPTDEELIVEYLQKKLRNSPLPINRMRDVNLYNHNPWELTEKFTSYEKNEYYFFTPRDRKYPKGFRPKRAAGIGYWKAVGKDKPIYDSNGVEIGSKMMLRFFKGKHPKGDKTPWVMHEYKAIDVNDEGTTNATTTTTTNVRAGLTAATRSANGGDMQLDEWVLCKLYQKEEPASTPPAAAAPATAAPAAPAAAAAAAAAAAPPPPAAENHLSIIQVENTATREENTAMNIYPGSDIYFAQGMFCYGRSNEVSFLKNGGEGHQENVLPIEYKEEQNYDQDTFNVIQAENTATGEEKTASNIYPGSDIYIAQGMFLFGRSNEVSFSEKEEERHQEDLSLVEYREEPNCDQDTFNVDDYLVIPPDTVEVSDLIDP